ncbi:FUSC family protein [Flavobacterium silvaticum]|uniref:FUSC family protein n=1 Tax=Flavobacterium silvaticum TaxID=1852020 RepID=A0A972JG63_9FLAO|nr:FUSC family protein [Flavobacterium silvaticum]NMH27866.1 FUSC family protein [Flavobacterium silvaticum]
MNKKDLVRLTDEEVLQELKKSKSTAIFDAVLIGLLIGIGLYSTIKNGFGLLTFLPLIYVPIAGRNKVKSNELKRLATERNLE